MSTATATTSVAAPLRPATAGLTLIELVVAMAIGSFLVIGAITVFTQGQTAFRASESTARLQENARLAVAILESDVRMAGYFGLTARASAIDNRASAAQPIPPGLAVRNDCELNWAIDLDAVVAGTNNGFGWAACSPLEGAQADADTLVVRRTSTDPTPLDELRAGTLYVQSARYGAGRILRSGAPPEGSPPPTGSRSFRLLTRGYYVSGHSSLDAPGNPVPSLRVKTLAGGSMGPGIVDQEVLPGIEDLQVQFGVDTDPVGHPGRGSINRYVNPGDPVIDPAEPAFQPEARVLTVRVWLRLRAEFPEQGFVDTAEYVYADRRQPAMNDRFRRLVVIRTIRLRNASLELPAMFAASTSRRRLARAKLSS